MARFIARWTCGRPSRIPAWLARSITSWLPEFTPSGPYDAWWVVAHTACSLEQSLRMRVALQFDAISGLVIHSCSGNSLPVSGSGRDGVSDLRWIFAA